MTADEPGAGDALRGVKVLDLTTLLPGPFAGQILRDLGADVIKVEPPRGDPMRVLSPEVFPVANRGKRSIGLDLKSASDSAVLEDLVAGSDVLIESYRPGVLARLGFDDARLARVRPGLVLLSMSGWGQQGPDSQAPGHDGNYMARTGALFLAADDGQPPSDPTPINQADMAGALYAVIGVLAALRQPRPADRIVHLDVSLFASGLSLMVPRLAQYVAHGGRPTGEELMRRRPGHGVFRSSDDRFLLLAAVEDHFWSRLCEAIERPDLATREDLQTFRARHEHVEEIRAAIAAAVATRPLHEWLERLEKFDVPASAVLEPWQVPLDPQVAHLGLMQDWPNITSFLPIFGLPGGTPPRSVPTLEAHGDAIREHGWGNDGSEA